MTASRPPAPFPGFLLAVGGQCRKVGKSTLVADIIRAFPDWHWTAVKITPYAESGCPIKGSSCNCPPEEHSYAIREETCRLGNSDSFALPGCWRPPIPVGRNERARPERCAPSAGGRIGERRIRIRRDRKRCPNEVLDTIALRHGPRSLKPRFQGLRPRESPASRRFRVPFAIR